MKCKVMVPIAEIEKCKEWRESLRLCLDVSGKSLNAVADACGYDHPGILARILNPSTPKDVRHMPGDVLVQFMAACGNTIPLQWLLRQMGEPAGIEADMTAVREDMAEIRRQMAELAVTIGCGQPRYSVVGAAGSPTSVFCPDWLREEIAAAWEAIRVQSVGRG